MRTSPGGAPSRPCTDQVSHGSPEPGPACYFGGRGHIPAQEATGSHWPGSVSQQESQRLSATAPPQAHGPAGSPSRGPAAMPEPPFSSGTNRWATLPSNNLGDLVPGTPGPDAPPTLCTPPASADHGQPAERPAQGHRMTARAREEDTVRPCDLVPALGQGQSPMPHRRLLRWRGRVILCPEGGPPDALLFLVFFFFFEHFYLFI